MAWLAAMPSPRTSVLGRRSTITSDALTTSPGLSERVKVAASTVSVTVPVKRNAERRDNVLPGSSKAMSKRPVRGSTFMRATKAPPRDTALAATAAAVAGSTLFNQIGCNICHVRDITTAPAGTLINGGAFTVPAALGNKIIHPFSDFLLHDVGTGDGIVQNGGQSTANKLRTSPLWGSRTHARHMHDGESLTFTDAILRHAGEATTVINRFRALTANQRNQIVVFLQSL